MDSLFLRPQTSFSFFFFSPFGFLPCLSCLNVSLLLKGLGQFKNAPGKIELLDFFPCALLVSSRYIVSRPGDFPVGSQNVDYDVSLAAVLFF